MTNPRSTTVTFDQPIVTLSDLIVKIGARNGMGDGDTRMQRMITGSIRDALRDFPGKSAWRYYDRTFNFDTSAQVSLQVTYVDSTRTATVTSGVMPTDMALGEVLMKGKITAVESVSGSTFVLRDYVGSNVTGTALWFRSAYTLPKIATMRRVIRDMNRQELGALQNEVAAKWMLAYNSPGTPVGYTLRADSTIGANDIVLCPPPSTGERYVVSAVLAPKYPSVAQAFGDASGTSGTATFTAPQAKPNWVGAVVRASPSSSQKTEDLTYGEFEWQSIIKSVSSTTVTLYDNLPSSFTAETVLVSSPIDISLTPGIQTYFESMCHEYYCRNHKHDGLADAIAVSNKLFMDARAADSMIDKSTPLWFGASWPWVITDLRYGRLT